MSAARQPSRSQDRPAGTGPEVLDLWLRTELSRRFDATLAEPVPDDLLRILQEAPEGTNNR